MADQTLDLATYLEQLEAQQAHLAIQIVGVRAALGLEPGSGVTNRVTIGGSMSSSGASTVRVITSTGVVRSDEFFRMSLPEAIRKYLEIRKAPQTPKEIMEGIKAGGILSEAKHFYANVFTSLRRLRKQGLVMNTKSGGWGLAEWYAGRSGGAAETKSKRKKPAKATKTTKAAKPPKKPKKAPKAASPAPKQASGYRAFIAEQMRAGKTMKDAATAWREKQGSA